VQFGKWHGVFRNGQLTSIGRLGEDLYESELCAIRQVALRVMCAEGVVIAMLPFFDEFPIRQGGPLVQGGPRVLVVVAFCHFTSSSEQVISMSNIRAAIVPHMHRTD
jgi:hypothetical protein